MGCANPRAVGTRLSIRGLTRATPAAGCVGAELQPKLDRRLTSRDSSGRVGGQLIGYPEIAPNVRYPNGMAGREWPRRRHGMAVLAEQGARRRHGALGAQCEGSCGPRRANKPGRQGGCCLCPPGGMQACDRRQSDGLGGQHIILRSGGGWCAHPDSLVLQALIRGCMLYAHPPLRRRA